MARPTVSTQLVTLAVWLSLIGIGVDASFRKPDYVETCSRKTPDLDRCALESGRKVIPHIIPGDSKLKLPRLDPLILERIEVVPAGNTRSVGLTIKCLQCHIGGLKNIQLNAIRLNLEKMSLEVDASIPELSLEGNYEASGRVLILPVSGKGDGSLVAKDSRVRVKLDWKLESRKNMTFAQVQTYKVDFDTKRLNIKLDNLFNGDRLLGSSMNNFLNDNWKEVLQDLYPAISDTIGEIIKTIINQVFSQIPYEQIFPNE